MRQISFQKERKGEKENLEISKAANAGEKSHTDAMEHGKVTLIALF